MLGLDAVMGNFGMSVPFQELDDSRYPVVPLADLGLDDFDAVMIPGAFCPWNCLDDGLPVELCRRAAAAGTACRSSCAGAPRPARWRRQSATAPRCWPPPTW